MRRCFGILASAMLLSLPAWGDEFTRPLQVVLVHGTEAEYWLSRLGKDHVRVELLVPNSTEGEDWIAAERNVRRIELPTAFVASSCDDCMLPRYWSERFRNQGAIEIITLESSRWSERLVRQQHCVQKVHGLLVKLCPEAKAILDERVRVELLQLHRKHAAYTNESFAGVRCGRLLALLSAQQ